MRKFIGYKILEHFVITYSIIRLKFICKKPCFYWGKVVFLNLFPLYESNDSNTRPSIYGSRR